VRRHLSPLPRSRGLQSPEACHEFVNMCRILKRSIRFHLERLCISANRAFVRRFTRDEAGGAVIGNRIVLFEAVVPLRLLACARRMAALMGYTLMCFFHAAYQMSGCPECLKPGMP